MKNLRRIPATILLLISGTTLTSAQAVGGEGHKLSEITIGGIVLEPASAIDGRLSLLVPKQFSVMDNETITQMTACRKVNWRLSTNKWRARFETSTIDTEIRNILVGTSLQGRLLIVSFNVTKDLEEAWLPPADAIIQSLHIVD